MNVIHYPTPAAFVEAAGSFLETHEVKNSLLLGNALRHWRGSAAPGGADVYYAAAWQGERMVGALSWQPPHNPILSAETSPPAIEALARHLLDQPLPVTGVFGPAPQTEVFVPIWERLTGQAARLRVAQGNYMLREVRFRGEAPGSLRKATLADLELLTRWAQGFHADISPHEPSIDAAAVARQRLEGGLYLWEVDGVPVSIACRNRPTRHGITVSMVYTPPKLRGHGYATTCVAALSQRLLDEGYAFCTLFTDLANPTSNRIYQRIGYERVCDFMLYGFEDAGRS